MFSFELTAASQLPGILASKHFILNKLNEPNELNKPI
jgi:hypothetical protein